MAHPVATADCIAWYRGDSLVDGGGGVASDWNDKSGNAYHLADTNGPTIVDSGLNGRLAASFAFASDQSFDRATTPAASQPFTFAIIVKPASTFPAEEFVGLMSNLYFRQYGGGGSGFFAETYAGGATNTTSTVEMAYDAWALIATDFNGTSSLMHFDNVQVNSGSGLGTDAFSGLQLGSEHFNGLIAEAVIWDRTLNGTELTELYDYYQSYYYAAAAAAGLVGQGLTKSKLLYPRSLVG